MILTELETDHRLRGEELPTLEHLLASGELLASQLPSASAWSPEKKLAAAVLSSALVEIRDHAGDLHYRRRVAEDLEWVFSDDAEWPFSFLRLCELFGLEPEYVRRVVKRWHEEPKTDAARRFSAHRYAA